jgi:hypothetical protein
MPLRCGFFASVYRAFSDGWYPVASWTRTRYFDIGVMCFPTVLHNSPHAPCIDGILELPKRVPAEIEAFEEGFPPWQGKGFPFEP